MLANMHSILKPLRGLKKTSTPSPRRAAFTKPSQAFISYSKGQFLQYSLQCAYVVTQDIIQPRARSAAESQIKQASVSPQSHTRSVQSRELLEPVNF